MPRVKELPPKLRTFPFKVKIISITYHRFDKRGVSYCARVRCVEMSHSKEVNEKNVFCATIWLNETQYNKKVIAHNDILRFTDQIYWISKGEYEYRYYGKDNLSIAGRKEIHADEKNRPYVVDKIYPFAISVPQGEWKIVDKMSDEIVAKVGYDWEHCISIIFDSEEEIIEFNGGSFYLENFEYEKLKEKRAQTVKFKPYVYRNPLEPKTFYMDIYFDEQTGKYIMDLSKSKKNEGE